MEKSNISARKLFLIGQEVASLWGAVCTGHKTLKDKVRFYCNEAGEEFITELTYKEIETEYDYIEEA